MNNKLETIAKVCHEANRAYSATLGDFSHKSWEESSEQIKASAITGVKLAVEKQVTPKELHESWMKQKAEEGWTYGEEKDFDKKTHPCFVPYEELPVEQQTKDALFGNIVAALK